MKLSKYHKQNVEYRQHQKEALSKLSKTLRFLLSLPTGTGKTLTALSVFAYSLEHGKSTRMIFILEPKNAKQTIKEVAKYFEGIPTLLMTGKDKKARKALYEQFISNPEHKIMVINYELVRNDVEELSRIYRYHQVTTIADEGTILKNRTSKIHKVMARFFAMSQRGVVLTATPVMKSLEDLHVILQCIGVKAVSDWDFYKNHCVWKEKTFGKRKVRYIDSYKGIEEYHRKVSEYIFSRPKSEILDVSFAYSKRFLPLGDLEREALSMVMSNDNQPIAHIAIALSSPCLILDKDHDLLSEKEKDLINFIDNDLENKMIVYSPFKTVILRLEKLLNEKYGKGFAVSIHGDVKDPEPIKHQIINNPKTKILLGTSSLEKGMDGVQTVVDTVYPFTLPITAGSFLQLIGRTSRDGGNFNMITVALPFMGGNLIDWDLWILIQNQLKLIQRVTPDSLEKGCIDEDMERYLPEETITDPNEWIRSKIKVKYRENEHY